MNNNIKIKAVGIIDKIAYFFFIVMAFFLPISKAALESSFGFIFLCFVLKLILERPSIKSIRNFFNDRINLSLLIFYIAIGISLTVSGPLFMKSLKAWLFKWGEGFLLFYFARIFLRKEQIKTILSVFIISGLLICLDGLYQWVFGLDFLRGFALTEVGNFVRVRATFNHFNDFATYLIVLFFINYGFFIYFRKFRSIIFSLGLALLIMINLFFTYSRGGWLSFLLVSLFLVVFLKDKKNRAFFISFLIFFLYVIFTVPSLRDRFIFILKDGGDSDRFRMWRIAFSMFQESPLLGKGLGLFMDYLPKYIFILPQYAHNCYLQILAETGLLGLIPFLWFLGEIIFRAGKKISKNIDSLFLGLFIGFLVLLIHSFFDTQLFSLQLSILFWLLSSLLVIN